MVGVALYCRCWAQACVGGGSNAIGLFHPFLKDESVKIIGVEAGGAGTEGNKVITVWQLRIDTCGDFQRIHITR